MTKPKQTRRDRFLARERPKATYQFAVVDDIDAVAELAAAKRALEMAELRLDDDRDTAVAAAEERVQAAKSAVADCYEPIMMTALERDAFEALVAEHPAKDERWNKKTFPRACFLACVDTADLKVEEWDTWLNRNVAEGEQTVLFGVAIGVNTRWPSGAVPND